jgi:hypothetical protein
MLSHAYCSDPLTLPCPLPSPSGDDSSRSSLVAVGTWAKELLVARVEPGGSTGGGPVPLAVLTREALMGEVIPRRWGEGPSQVVV